jgi:hypothetical protein
VAGTQTNELIKKPGGGFLAEHDAALGAELDFKYGAGVDAESLADGLGQSELALAGDGSFHFLTLK